ncbi:hypothetical protein GQR58_019989 [Nymphon striatum]|nr:hypothetical protein GQR58_019989 [Nymphon striatum]
MNISTGETTQSMELIDARQRGLDALEKTEESKAKKVDPVKLKTFVEKTKKQPAQQQTKELYMEERAVICDLCFSEQVGQKEKINAFSHEWTKYPSSIFIPDPAGFAMPKGNKSDYGTMLKTTMALQWKEPEELPASVPPRCTLILGGMTRGPAKLLSSVGVSDNELLSCDGHEEADTRLFTHVAYSAKEQGCRRAVISATDTDIVMLGQFHTMKGYSAKA